MHFKNIAKYSLSQILEVKSVDTLFFIPGAGARIQMMRLRYVILGFEKDLLRQNLKK
jgi:hypothetical protein